MIYSFWDIEQNILKLVILGHFLPFYHPKKTLKSKFWKMKKFAGDIVIVHMCTKNHNNMMYGSWDMEWHKHKFMSFWTVFCPFIPLTTPKIKILKKWKKCLKISSFYICAPKIIIQWCMVPEIWCVTDKWTDRKSDIIEVGTPPQNHKYRANFYNCSVLFVKTVTRSKHNFQGWI